jgi:hypothetical protein
LLILLYSIASPALHQIWLAMHGEAAGAGKRFVVMVVGDLSGSLIVIYAIKLALWVMVTVPPLRRRLSDS